MQFRDDRQRARVCHTILHFQHLERFFPCSELGVAGPTPAACLELANAKAGQSLLSSSERTLLGVAFDFWNGAGGVSVWEIQSNLEVNIIHGIGELLIAVNEDPELRGSPVDRWVDRWRHHQVHKSPEGFTVG